MRVLSVIAAGLMATGCMHVTVAPPGVLDVRTDAADAPKAPALAPNEETGPRGGFGWFVFGEGVAEVEGRTEIADRQHIVVGLVPVLNDMGAAETAAVTKGAALRDVRVGDGLAGSDILWELAGVLLAPCTFGLSNPTMNLILPPWTTTISGKRVAVEAASPAEVPPPPAVDAPVGGGQ